MQPLPVLAGTLAIAAAGAWCAAAEKPLALEVEAEAAYVVKPPLTVREARGASGGKVLYADIDLWHKADRFVVIEPKPGLVAGVGLAEYRIDVPADGEYAAWFRCWYLNSGDDSFYFRADEGNWSIISELKEFEWRWIRGPVLKLEAGRHRLQIAGREDNSILDKFLLVADKAYVPEEESRRLGPSEPFTMPVPHGPAQPGPRDTYLNHFDQASAGDATYAKGDPRFGGMRYELGQPGRWGRGVRIAHAKAYGLVLGRGNVPANAATLEMWFKPNADIFTDGQQHYLLSLLHEPWLDIKSGPLAQHRKCGQDQLFVVVDGQAKQLRLRLQSPVRNTKFDLLSLPTDSLAPTPWHHVAVSWDKRSRRMWLALDGRGQTRQVRAGWDFRPVLGAYVGSAIYYNVLEPIQGTVDELRVRNASLQALLASGADGPRR